MPLAYAFRPMTTTDLPLVRRWLGETHVREWWGDPDEQFALVSGDLDEPAMDQFIVLAGIRPFGYLQCYSLTAWNTGFGPQPEGTRGIDQFIGASDMIGRGHGSAFIPSSPMRAYSRACPASSRILMRSTCARCAPMRRRDSSATAWSRHPTARRC